MSEQNPAACAPGSKVVIRFNPHMGHASDIVGTVLRFHPGAGFLGCDLADVQYEDPRDGTIHVLPFGTHNLDVGDRTRARIVSTRSRTSSSASSGASWNSGRANGEALVYEPALRRSNPRATCRARHGRRAGQVPRTMRRAALHSRPRMLRSARPTTRRAARHVRRRGGRWPNRG